jgi:hypothetical protein
MVCKHTNRKYNLGHCMGLSWWFTVFVLFVYDGSSDLSCVTFIWYDEHIIRCRLKATQMHKMVPLLDLHVHF